MPEGDFRHPPRVPGFLAGFRDWLIRQVLADRIIKEAGKWEDTGQGWVVKFPRTAEPDPGMWNLELQSSGKFKINPRGATVRRGDFAVDSKVTISNIDTAFTLTADDVVSIKASVTTPGAEVSTATWAIEVAKMAVSEISTWPSLYEFGTAPAGHDAWEVARLPLWWVLKKEDIPAGESLFWKRLNTNSSDDDLSLFGKRAALPASYQINIAHYTDPNVSDVQVPDFDVSFTSAP